MEVFTYIVLFIIGILLGSFYTLAVYRIPREENIVYQHSYCPNCHHKLGFLDLIPILSYLCLGGKCRYCHKKVRIRYLMLELLSGLVLVLYGYVTKFNILLADKNTIIHFFLMTLFFIGIFLIAGIDKERKNIEASVLWYELFVVLVYMVYICTLQRESAYIYIIYLSILIGIILWDIVLLRKYAKPCYITRVFILLMAMLMVNGIRVMILTIAFMLTYIVMNTIIKKIKQGMYRFRQVDNPKRILLPIGFILCTSHVVAILVFHWLQPYISLFQ